MLSAGCAWVTAPCGTGRPSRAVGASSRPTTTRVTCPARCCTYRLRPGSARWTQSSLDKLGLSTLGDLASVGVDQLGLRFGKVKSWNPEESAWDGVGEVWFESEESAAKAFATEPYASALVEDRKKFMGEAQSCFVVEHTVVTPPDGR